ncbi:hypothetical protein RVB1_19100 [Escherichia coli]|nr:hypothetical protein RVB1_19100 [Escherichia coli]
MNIQCKRVYDPAEQSDGYRILVDRLWPRGIKKTDLALDEWDKEITPSTELAKPFTAKSSIMQPFASNILQNWRNTSKKESGWRTSPKNSR